MQNLITIIAPQLLVAGAYSFIGEIKGFGVQRVL